MVIGGSKETGILFSSAFIKLYYDRYTAEVAFLTTQAKGRA